MTSFGGSSKANILPSSKIATPISGPITRIDLDVAFGEIAGPESRFAATPAANREFHRALRLIQLHFQLVFRKTRRQACAAYRDTLKIDVDATRIERDSGIPSRRK